MPRPKNPLVQELMQQGMGRRQAFQLAKIVDHPVALAMFQERKLSLADAAGMATRWPYRGEQALLSVHVSNGWKLKDAEIAYSAAVQEAVRELDAVNPNISDADALKIVDERVCGPIRRGEFLPGPRIVHNCTIQPPPPDPLIEAVAEIRRLRSKLQDLGVDPDS